MPEAPAGAILPISVSGAGDVPNLLVRVLRDWPDATARTAIVAVACALFWLTWAHWGDIQIDCGREVYVPYQILRGKLLYRDLWYPYGPLEPYISALLLKLFGQHLSVLYSFGLTLVIGCALALYELGAMLALRAVGLTTALAFLLQGFEPPTQGLRDVASMFNYVFPYSYAAMVGLLLALLCAFFTIRHVLGRHGANLMLAGLAAGLALLSKQEFGGACYILLAFVLLMEAIQQRSLRALLYGLGRCVPGLLLNVAIYGWLFWMLTPDFVFDNWFGPNRYFVRIYGTHLYAIAGMRLVPLELAILVFSAGLALFLWHSAAKASRSHIGHRRFFAVVALLALGMAASRQFTPSIMYSILATFIFPRGMFFIGCVFFAYTLYELRRNPGDQRLLAKAAFALFALVLTIRVLAQVGPYGYSIYYDMPLFLVFMIVGTECIRAAAPAISAGPQRKLVNSLLAAEAIMLAVVLIPGASVRTARLETSWGDIYLQPAEATAARQIIDFISQQTRQGRGVVLLPELPMLYALTGTEAPSRLYTLQPGFLPPSQEDDYIANLKRANSYYIVLTNRNTSEYGVPYFGIDYDQKIYRWIEANYRVIDEFGNFRRDGSRLLTAILYERRKAIGTDSLGRFGQSASASVESEESLGHSQ